ncbi:MAG: pilin [Desulfovibrio sp.]|nr:pilin [Desulfovibrio sp.]
MSEAFNLAGGQKGAVSEFHSNWGDWPVNNASAGIASASSIQGKYVLKVTVEDGSIIAKIRGKGEAAAGIQNKELRLGVTFTGGSYKWACNSDADNKYLPAACRK